MKLSLDEAFGLLDIWREVAAPVRLVLNRGEATWDGSIVKVSPGNGTVTMSFAIGKQCRRFPLNSANFGSSHGQGSFSILAEYPDGKSLLFFSLVAFGIFTSD